MAVREGRSEKIRLGIEGRQVTFAIERDGEDSWRVWHGERLLGTAYKLREGKWRARRPGGSPAPQVEHDTRAAAIGVLYRAGTS